MKKMAAPAPGPENFRGQMAYPHAARAGRLAGPAGACSGCRTRAGLAVFGRPPAGAIPTVGMPGPAAPSSGMPAAGSATVAYNQTVAYGAPGAAGGLEPRGHRWPACGPEIPSCGQRDARPRIGSGSDGLRPAGEPKARRGLSRPRRPQCSRQREHERHLRERPTSHQRPSPPGRYPQSRRHQLPGGGLVVTMNEQPSPNR